MISARARAHIYKHFATWRTAVEFRCIGIARPEARARTRGTQRYPVTLSLPPPPPPSHEFAYWDALLCGRRRELLWSTCRGNTEGWKSCWPLSCCYFLQHGVNIAGSLADRLLQPAARLHGSAESLASGNRPKSVQSQDFFSNYFYTLNNTHMHVQELQYCKPARAARGGGI